MMHILNEWLMFSSASQQVEPSLWSLALAAAFASAMILGRRAGD